MDRCDLPEPAVRGVTDSPGGRVFQCAVAPLDLKGLYVTAEEWATLLNAAQRCSTVQKRREERSRAERRVPIR
ncbi:hypothetical protein PBY51_023812 [Eleginops maclovinus]|uniref:Uncharacterized protein n=1 Tax=Eleginops maclovinus TaxID=56733 RepID=A0AAN7X0K7_ELEMC|nr:hypothetical protein PBY51_023812 [Eleginops maclovinus]